MPRLSLRLALVGLAAGRALGEATASGEAWETWLLRFGHDDWRYPAWIADQRRSCHCEVLDAGTLCHDDRGHVDWQSAEELTWCSAMHFLLNHMPAFDLDYLPPAVTVEGDSMLDDNVAFALMAWNASALQPRPPAKVAFEYLLPYATFHEARSNWRPLFFAKYFQLAAGLPSARAVVDSLISNNVRLMSWTEFQWKDFAGKSPANSYQLGPFASSTAPPALAPFDVVAYGYASCTGWAKMLSSALKAVGVPAREVGSPCWNTAEFQGLAVENPNVSACWAGGLPNGPSGGVYLNDHTWVEYWDNVDQVWRFTDVASSSSAENTWFCGQHSDATGCACSSNAGKAAADHGIYAPTWSSAGDAEELNGGHVLDVSKSLILSNGEAVSPLVWAARLRSPRGTALKNVGLRLVNRTDFYRCRPPPEVI